MPPAAPQQLPAQVNPQMLAALRARVQQALAARQGAAGPMPNSMNGPVPQAPPAGPGQIAPQATAAPGGGTPAQQGMKAAAQAQMSPFGQDPETRASAKDLIMKLMKHM